MARYTYTLIVDGKKTAEYSRKPPKDIRALSRLKGIQLTKYDNKQERFIDEKL